MNRFDRISFVAVTTATLTIPATFATAQDDAWPAGAGPMDSPRGAVSWERGTPGTAFAQWNVFYDAFDGPNYPDDGVFGPGATAPTFDNLSVFFKPLEDSPSAPGTGTGASYLKQTNAAAFSFIIAPGVSGNIYSIGGPFGSPPMLGEEPQTFDLSLAGFKTLTSPEPGFKQQLTITTLTEGFGSVEFTATPDGAVLLGRRELFVLDEEQDPNNPTEFLNVITQEQWTFDITNVTDDVLDFSIVTEGPSVSFQKLSADSAFVPAPGVAGALALAGVAAARRRR